MKEQLVAFLQDRIGKEVSFTEDDDIFALGLINSMFALQLVLFLEGNFGISVENQDLDLNNFNTVNNMLRFVQRKQAPAVREMA
jgi:acyl carrier protein